MNIVQKTNRDKYFTEIYEQYSAAVYKFCLSKLNCDINAAQDCTQEAFTVFYKRLLQGEEFSNPRAFIYRAANNFIMKRYDEIKKTNKKTASIDDYENSLSDNTSISKDLDYELITNRISEVLDEDEFSLFEMRFIDEMKVADISEKLNITRSNCSMRITRLRKKLIDNLGDYI